MSPSAPEQSLTTRWLTANLLGCLASGVVVLSGDAVKHGLLAASGEGVRIPFMAVVAAMAAATWSYVVATVLRAKVPALRTRTWVIAHAAAWLLLGGFTEWLGENDEPLTFEDATEWVALGALMMLGGAALVAGVGVFHALLMRSAARGLGLWIGCSALAGLSIVLFMPFWVWGPQSGFRYTLVTELAALVIGMIWAFAMLPALRRLTPREPQPPLPS